MGTEEHGEWPQEPTGRQNSGYNGSDPQNLTGVQPGVLNGVGGAGLFQGREARRGTGREMGVPGTPVDVEQMSFAGKGPFPEGLRLVHLESYKLRPPTSPSTKDPIWYRKMRSEGISWEVFFHRHQFIQHLNLIISPCLKCFNGSCLYNSLNSLKRSQPICLASHSDGLWHVLFFSA